MPKITDWQKQMATGFSRVHELLEWLELDPDLFEALTDTEPHFPMKVPHAYAARIRKGDPHDPLLRQVLPLQAEKETVPGFVCDPVGDLAATGDEGMIQKYHGRALLVTTGACAIHCRYCFRRHFPYQSHRPDRVLSADCLEGLRHEDIEEVILSGGDPLTLGDRRLKNLIDSIGTLGSLRRLRIHTRLPVVVPDRVTSSLIDILREFRTPVTVVLHINHPNEIDLQTKLACRRLFENGIHLLNQAVLLRGVNDDAGVLERLCVEGFEAGVLPYYVHQLDRVAGSAHFFVAPDDALKIEQRLRELLPGYLLPRFVSELQGERSKLPLSKAVY